MHRTPPGRRLAGVFLASTLLLTACGAVDDVAEGIRDAASEAADAIEDVASEASQGGDGTSDGTADGGSTDGSATDGGDAPADGDGSSGALGAPTDDFASVGFHGPAMLRGSVDRLVVEIDTQEGVQPSQSAVDHLVGTMRQIVDKPGGVVLAGGNTFASSRTEWTSADLREVASANRNNFSGNGTVVVYVLYVDGGFFADGEQTSAIGVAYNASEFAIFPSRFRGGLLGGNSTAIERAVIVHEWGHLLGLVNIGYTSEIDHEDPEHSGHSRDKGSVMYYAIESTLIGQIFSGSPPENFGDADLADLEGIRTGKYRA